MRFDSQPPSILMYIIRILCVTYWLLLSVLLLVSDPLALLGIEHMPGPPGGRGIHFAFFTLLALLIHASRLPVGRALLWSTVVMYAMAAESLQSFVPHRVVDVVDLMENLLGLAAGTGIWLLLQKTLAARAIGSRNAPCRSRSPCGGKGELLEKTTVDVAQGSRNPPNS